MKTTQLSVIMTIVVAIMLALSLSSCSWIAEPEPELTYGVVVSAAEGDPYISGSVDKCYTLTAKVKIDGMTHFATFPAHLRDVIVEGREVKCRTRCGDIWVYKDDKGKWRDVTWGESIVKD